MGEKQRFSLVDDDSPVVNAVLSVVEVSRAYFSADKNIT